MIKTFIKMCPKKEEQQNTLNSVSNSDVNVTIKKHQQLTHPGKSTSCSNDMHSVDLRIQTNVEIISNKKIKLCLLMNVLICVMCISGSVLMMSNMHMKLVHIQNEILLLNEKLSSMSKTYQNVQNSVVPEFKQVFPENTEVQRPTLNKKEKVNINYFLELNTSLPYRNRSRRANKRNRQTTQRRVKSSGALAVHFKGSLPEIHIKDQGLIGPWYPDNVVSRQYKFPKFHLTEGKCSIEVTEPALYLIYAQVYYITSSALNSFSVYVRSEGSSENVIIARCSAIGPNNSHVAEISCYTSAVYSLKSNDRIFIQQTEKNRTINLRDGHSFFGVVRLNNSLRNKS